MTNTVEIDRRAVLGLVGGAAVASAATRACRSRASDGGEGVALWLVDRDADRLVGLSAGLARRVEVRVPCPVAVESAGEHGAWVLVAPERTSAHGRRRLELVGPDGRRRVALEVWEPTGMRGGADGAVWVLARRGKALVGITPDLRRREIELPESVRAFAVHPRGAVLVAARSGALVSGSLDDGGRWEHAACPERFTLDVAAHDDGWWVLARDRVVLADRELRVRWAVALDDAAGRLFAEGGEARALSGAVWHLDARGERLVRFHPEERRVVARGWPLAGVSGAASLGRDGLVVVAPGTVLAFDSRGELRPGQGGFRHLVDVAAVARGVGG